MGTSRSTGRSTIVSAMSAYTANGASLFSRTRITFVLVVPPTVISSTSLSARMNCGECGSDPVMGGSPKKENLSVTSDITKKFRWLRGALGEVIFRFIRQQGGNVHLHTHQQREERPGTRGAQGEPARPRAEVHDPRAATIRRYYRRRYREHLQPVHAAAPRDERPNRDGAARR